MLPDDPDQQARLFYLVALGMAILIWGFAQYRNRLGQAAQHAAIWALIFLGAVLAFGFYEPLKRSLTGGDQPLLIDDSTVALKRGLGGHFYAVLQINDRDVEFLVDTGATSMVLAKRDAEAAGIDTAELNYILPTSTANGRVMSAPVRLDKVQLGKFTDRNVRATISGGELNQSLLGMEYLDLYRGFEVDGDRMYLKR